MAARYLKRNCVFHILDGIFFFAALTILSRQVLIPQMIAELTDSELLLGLVPLVFSLGILVPQAFHAKNVEGLPYKKRRVLLCACIQRVGWLLLLLSMFFFWRTPHSLVVLFVALGLSALGSGLIIPVWTDWFAKTTPDGLWGKLLGARRAMAGPLGIAAGLFLIPPVMTHFPAPARYRILTGIAIGFYALSVLMVAMVKEDEQPGLPNHRATPWGDYFKDLARILFRRRDFRRFMIASQLLGVPVVVMMTFLAKYGLTWEPADDAVSGTFTLFFFGASGLGGLVGGVFSDRAGPVPVLRVLPGVVIASAGLACISQHTAVVSGAFALLGFAFGALLVVRLPAVFLYAGPERRPSYAAVSFMFLGLGNALTPVTAGALLDAGLLTFRGMFVACAVLAAAGSAVFFTVARPRPHAT